jgi:glucose-1-phosphate cytidylyltransferase
MIHNLNINIKILILCGGKGERLKPLTESIPKPLVKIQERPILSYLLSYFKRLGFRKFVIAVGYKSEVIIQYFRNEHRDLEIEIVDSGDADIVRRIQDSATHLPGDFILCYGDTLADVDLNDLIRFHQNHNGDVSITVFPLQSQFGVLDIEDNNRVVSFVEKPVLDKWINIGYYYFSHRIIGQIVKYDNFVDFLQATATAGQLYSYKHEGVHITVNTFTELQDAERNITLFLNNNRGMSDE